MSSGDVIDADVAEALKQLKRGFGADVGAGQAAKPRPPPPAWQPQKAARTMPPQIPKAQPSAPLPIAANISGGLQNLLGQQQPVFQSFGAPGVANVTHANVPDDHPAQQAAPRPPKKQHWEAPNANANLGAGKTQIVLEIPHSAVGLVIGKQAGTINAIKVMSRAHCFVDQPMPGDAMAKVTIQGASSEIDKCKMAVNGLVNGSMSTDMVFQLAGLPPPGATPSPGAAASTAPATSYGNAAATSGHAAVPQAPAPQAVAPPAPSWQAAAAPQQPIVPQYQQPQALPPMALPQMPYPQMPKAGGPNLLASTISMSTNNAAGMPMDNTVNEYYARWWSQYGGMVQNPAAPPPGAPGVAAGGGEEPKAFDKDALIRLAQQAAQNAEDEKNAPPAPPPALIQAPPVLQAPPPMPMPVFQGDLAQRAVQEVRMLLGEAASAQMPTHTAAPVPPAAPPPPVGQMMLPRPQGFSGFSIAGQPGSVQQKDNASVQKMLERLQGNAQQTKEAIAVQPAAQMPTPHASQAAQVAGPTVVDAEGLEYRVVNARTAEEIEGVGREILKQFPSLSPEQLAELLPKMANLLNQYHGDFLTEISHLLTARLKALSSTQFALLLSAILLWPAETRERYAEFAKGFISAACTEMPSRLMELSPSELNCCLAAFMALGFVDYKFFTAVGRSALARHKTFGPSQLAALLGIMAEMRYVHVDLFNASAQVMFARIREIRVLDIIRVLRSFAKCSVPHEALCQATGDEIVRRYEEKGAAAGFRCEDLCEIAWDFCVLQTYHEKLFKLMFKVLTETDRVATDALCQVYECHLVLDCEHKAAYAPYRMDNTDAQGLLDHYKENRKDVRRCAEKTRNDVASALKSLVEGTVHSNHRTSLGLLVDVAALRKRTSTDGYIHIDIDSALTVVRPLDQDEGAPANFVLDGSVGLRRRILQKHDLRLITVRESDWRGLDGQKEKRRHLRSLLQAMGDVLE